MKNVFYLSISLLCLSISALIGFYIGSTSVQANAPGSSVVGLAFWSDHAYVLLENGDVYRNNAVPRAPAIYIGNYWGNEKLAPGRPSGSTDDQGGGNTD
jgi:hypothetical protein